MSGWIKFDKDMVNDPRLVGAANKLLLSFVIAKGTPGGGIDLSHGDAVRFMCHALRGALVTLWCYADEHIRHDDSLPCDVESLDAIVGIDGFCDAMPDEWIAVNDEGHVTLPGYCDKNSLIAKRKRSGRDAERQRRYRERIKASRTANVTRNDKRDNIVTLRGDQDQDQDPIERAKKPSRRVPKDFNPDLAYASAQLPDIDAAAEAQKFRDWEFKTPRSDWPACWRTWIGNCKSSGKYARVEQTKWM